METQSPPPIQGGNLHAPGSKWPTTLGIISIIFGIGGTIQGAMAPFAAVWAKGSMQTFVDQGADQTLVDDYLAKLQSSSYLSGGITLILGVILLIGGIMLLKRKTASPLILQVWSVAKILGGGFILFSSMAAQKMQMEIMFSGSGGPQAEMAGKIAQYMVWIILAFNFIWIIALPIFFLVWFNRDKIKTHISEW